MAHYFTPPLRRYAAWERGELMGQGCISTQLPDVAGVGVEICIEGEDYFLATGILMRTFEPCHHDVSVF